MSIEAIDRLDTIRTLVQRDGRVRVTELSESLGVSEMTIRRDLDVLVDEGVVRRVHGGAVASGPQQFGDRYGQQGRAKETIATKLAALVPATGTVAFDASSTVQRVAHHLDHARDLTVVTFGVETMLALRDKPGVTAVLTGGTISPRTGSLVGPLAALGARQMNYDAVFVSALGVDPTAGTSEPMIEEVEVKRALAAGAAQVVLAVDHTKLDVRAAARCFDLADIDTMVTDLDPDDPRLDPYRPHVQLH